MYMCKFTYLLWQGETAELVEMAEIATCTCSQGWAFSVPFFLILPSHCG